MTFAYSLTYGNNNREKKKIFDRNSDLKDEINTNVNCKAKIEKNEILPNNRIEEPSLIQRLLSYFSYCKE